MSYLILKSANSKSEIIEEQPSKRIEILENLPAKSAKELVDLDSALDDINIKSVLVGTPRRDEYVAAHLGAAGPPIDPPDQPACERAASPPILRNDAAARIEMDEVIQQRDTPPWNREWRTEVVTSILVQQLPQNARRPPEIVNTLELLAEALRKVPQDEQTTDQKDVDSLYQLVLDCIGREGRPKPPKRRKGHGRGNIQPYLYSRTQELFHKNPGIVARHVRNNVDWGS
ncbi:hypothetical protein JTB14_029041 [Gonioctena quinquepunctata]|nr:hypothetical protein JTB14_029041 [Gonioctena quinquepunctata]